MECRHFDFGVEEIDVRLMNGVRPEDTDSVWISDPRSENRTRFFARFGSEKHAQSDANSQAQEKVRQSVFVHYLSPRS